MVNTKYSLDYFTTQKIFKEKKNVKIFARKLYLLKDKNLGDKYNKEMNYKKIIELKRVKNNSLIKALFFRFLLKIKRW